jgi:outer membrane murein-binding lipoprotein Lpp
MTTSGDAGGIMSATEMDQLTTPAQPDAPADLQPAEAYSPPPALRRPGAPSAWAPMFQRQRRWWTIALVAAVLVSLAGVGVLYADDTTNQATIHQLTTQNEQLQGHGQLLQSELDKTNANLTATLGELAQTKAELDHPTLTIWNVPQQIKGPTWWLVGGIPDTFTYHLVATSTGPMSVSILTLDQFAAATDCVHAGRGPTNYCMHHSGVVWSQLDVTSVNYDFHLAEGCADYLAVFTAASKVTVTPNVSVTYQPATNATGACS